MDALAQSSRRERRRGRGASADPASRKTDYAKLRNPFRPQTVFSDDRVEAIHETSLRVLEQLGIKVLLPEARQILRSAGALVNESDQMVRIGREIVEHALAAAPRSILAKGGSPRRDITLELETLAFVAGCGAPNVTDLERGRRAGNLADFENLVRLNQSFDVLHFHGPYIEPQDIDLRFRHYATARAQLVLSDKLPFLFARGTEQAEDGFEMVRLGRGISQEEFAANAYCCTIVNTNSPRQLDVPMAQGIIDFARAGQAVIVTPFCLAGAMAPITVAGALTLQHAEALTGIALSQVARPGAPVLYGSFSSNVDMKSGAPAFGTPEHMKATLGAGQLARYLGLPWRAGGGSAANVPDAQAAHETQFALWGGVLAGSTVLVHSAGWLEGGLSVSFEKLITDLEVVQMVAEMCVDTPADDGAIGFDAIAEVAPGSHFFSAAHTMERFRTAFYEPLVADWSNFGNWVQSGSRTATERATGIWKQKLEHFQAPEDSAEIASRLDEFISGRRQQGGAAPVS
jgi:trimethylamine--corrinoid protein Co-methyltransferase